MCSFYIEDILRIYYIIFLLGLQIYNTCLGFYKQPCFLCVVWSESDSEFVSEPESESELELELVFVCGGGPQFECEPVLEV